MAAYSDKIHDLAQEFKACEKALLALGDENRQHLILKMMQMGECNGVRVGEITANSLIPQPWISKNLR